MISKVLKRNIRWMFHKQTPAIINCSLVENLHLHLHWADKLASWINTNDPLQVSCKCAIQPADRQTQYPESFNARIYISLGRKISALTGKEGRAFIVGEPGSFSVSCCCCWLKARTDSRYPSKYHTHYILELRIGRMAQRLVGRRGNLLILPNIWPLDRAFVAITFPRNDINYRRGIIN